METPVSYPPIPEGAPFLFENQDKPFAGDIHMEGEFIRLRDLLGLTTAVETGTCYGSTTLWLAEHFQRVRTIEVNEDFVRVAAGRLQAMVPKNDTLIWIGDSASLLSSLIAGILMHVGVPQYPVGNDTLFFLDAHFEEHCPLLDELAAIAAAGIRPVIVVHDVKVPGRPDLGFDTWNGQPFTYAWLRPSLDAIYGPNGFSHRFNIIATGAKRGVLYVYPYPAPV